MGFVSPLSGLLVFITESFVPVGPQQHQQQLLMTSPRAHMS